MSSPATRKRQRSVRLIVATALILLAAVLVTVAFLDNVAVFQLIAAIAAVVLGAAATRITHSELMATRREAGRDRAAQAQAYAELAESRALEHAEFTTKLTERYQADTAEREESISQLETALSQAQKELATARRQLRAGEKELAVTGRALRASEAQASEAIVRLAELEAEVDTLTAELASWRSGALRQRDVG